MINLENHQERLNLVKYESESKFDFEMRIKKRAIEDELEWASSNAREGAYEEAILRLVDIIETLQETS